jgi:hypothetical protein
MRPTDTSSLRLLIRSLCARWRSARQPSEEQYIAADGTWWGDGDIAADDFDDIDELFHPPDDDDDDDDDEEEEEDEEERHNDEGVDGDAGKELGGAQLSAALVEMAKQARFFLDARMRVGHGTAARLMGQLCCNSLTVYGRAAPGEELQEVGVALSASVAMFNHDCEPNADWTLDSDGCLVVRTLADVPRGRELCLSYVDVRLPAAVRVARLRRSFFFTCQCAACAAEVARWSCALCARLNGAFDDVCGSPECPARRAEFAMPVNKRRRRK